MKDPTYNASETHYIGLRALNDAFGYEKTCEEFSKLADKLTRALSMMPGCENFQVTFRNILERDCNPDGHQGFFRITNYNLNPPLDLSELSPSTGRDDSGKLDLFSQEPPLA